MPKMSRESATNVESIEGLVVSRSEKLGEYNLAFDKWDQDMDLTPLMKGLPDDLCQCPHWGIVLKGKLTYRYADGREETIEEGEAYYAPPGHGRIVHAGSEVVEFSPAEELQKTTIVMMRNMEAERRAA